MVDTRVGGSLGGDVVIDSKRYALYTERDQFGNHVLSWRHDDEILNQEGNPSQPVAAKWEWGAPNGMGEVQRISEDSLGCAFTVGMDTSTPGYVRLAGRRITVTPTTSPVDKPTGFFPQAPPGAAVYNVGTFTKSASAGTVSQAVTHGLSVAPVAVIFWTAGQTASGTVGAGKYCSLGFTDGTTSKVVSWHSADAGAASNCARRSASAVISLI